MPAVAYIIFVSSVILELLLMTRLLANRSWRHYLWLFLYISYTLVIMDLSLFGILQLWPRAYRRFYWEAEGISMGLRFLVIWEIFCNIFKGVPKLSYVVGKCLAAVALVPVLFALCAFLNVSTYQKILYFHVALERGFDFVQAFLVVGILFAARYYRLVLGKNVWGIAVGFGMYVSLSTAIFAMVSLNGSLAPHMQILSPLSFVAMLAIWAWALWTYAPNPRFVTEAPFSRDIAFGWWDDWTSMLAIIKRTRHL